MDEKKFFDDNIDFVGFVLTPLQVKNIIAFAEAFKITGSVVIAPHSELLGNLLPSSSLSLKVFKNLKKNFMIYHLLKKEN